MSDEQLIINRYVKCRSLYVQGLHMISLLRDVDSTKEKLLGTENKINLHNPKN